MIVTVVRTPYTGIVSNIDELVDEEVFEHLGEPYRYLIHALVDWFPSAFSLVLISDVKFHFGQEVNFIPGRGQEVRRTVGRTGLGKM